MTRASDTARLLGSGGLTVGSGITSNAGIVVDNITIDGTEIDLSSGDFTLDVAGNIFLNADGGDIRLVDGSTQFGVIQNNSNNLIIQSSQAGNDIILKGNDSGGSAVTAMTIDMSEGGRVGIGTTSPDQNLMISDTNNLVDHNVNDINKPTIGLQNTNTSNNTASYINFKSAYGHDVVRLSGIRTVNSAQTSSNTGAFTISTRNAASTLGERMRINSSGKVGISTSSPDAELHIEPAGSGSNASIVLANNGRSQYYRVQNNETSDALTFNANDSTQICQITGVNVGIFSTAQTARLNVESNLSSYSCVSLKNNNSNNSGVYLVVTNSSGGACGSISQNGSGNALFNTSSDYRLKENITYDWDATTRLKQLKPARFNFIEDNTNTLQDGFLAHEVSNIVPLAIVGDKDGTQDIGTIKDKDGKVVHENAPQARKEKEQTWTKTGTENVYQAIDHSKLVPLLVKTIQELEARITALEEN